MKDDMIDLIEDHKKTMDDLKKKFDKIIEEHKFNLKNE